MKTNVETARVAREREREGGWTGRKKGHEAMIRDWKLRTAWNGEKRR